MSEEIKISNATEVSITVYKIKKDLLKLDIYLRKEYKQTLLDNGVNNSDFENLFKALDLSDNTKYKKAIDSLSHNNILGSLNDVINKIHKIHIAFMNKIKSISSKKKSSLK